MKKLPCELAVWDSLPAIRAAIASEMVDLGLSQREVSSILQMAPSAISQYMSGKRGYRLEFTEETKQAIAALARDLSSGVLSDPRPRVCEICLLLRGPDDGCGVCMDEEGDNYMVPSN